MDILKKDYDFIFTNRKRNEILEECKNPINFTNLKKKINLSSPALIHHLEILEKYGLIKKEQIKEKGKLKRGGEVLIQTNKEKFEQLKNQFSKNILRGNELKSILRMLEQLKQTKEGLEFEDFTYFTDKNGYEDDVEDWVDWAQDFYGWGFVSTRFHLTNKGKKFLEDMKNKYPKIKRELEDMNKEITKIDKNGINAPKSNKFKRKENSKK